MAAAAIAASRSARATSAGGASDAAAMDAAGTALLVDAAEDAQHLRETVLKLEAQVKALQGMVYDGVAPTDTAPTSSPTRGRPSGGVESGHGESSASAGTSPALLALGSPARGVAPLEATLTAGLGEAPTNAALAAMRTSLPDGTIVSVRPEEVASMKAVFDMLDENGDGRVLKTELRELHHRLGEHIEESELDAALKAIEADGDGIDFTTFMRLWQGNFAIFYEDTDEAIVLESRRKRYQARFQMVKARISNPEVARISTRTSGTAGTLSYRVFFVYRGADGSEKQVSPWHDIPLRNADMSFNFICEIPKWTRAKFELATGEPFNPIKQDTKNGVLRDYKWGDMAFNYGAFPQTWEDPGHITPETGAIGDNDPIDVIEIGQRQWPVGAVVHVKVLGVLALIDSGETDWKVITISTEDPMASSLHDIEDVKAHMPGAVESFTEWLRLYKTHRGIVNEFGFDGQAQNRAYAEKTIEETHEFWKALVAKRGGAATV